MTKDVLTMLENKTGGEPSDLVFISRSEEKLKELSNAFNRAVDAVGLNNGIKDRRDKVVFHTLRHTFTSWLVQGGEGLFLVQRLPGHKTGTMTQRYAHLAPDNLKEAMKRFEDGLKAKPTTKPVSIGENRD